MNVQKLFQIENEKWIPWYHGKYSADIKWNIYSYIGKTQKKLKWNKNNFWYIQMDFWGKMFLSHRLVAKTFIPNSNKKPYINHIDWCKTNNCIENLEWCTAKENMQHARNMWLISSTKWKTFNNVKQKIQKIQNNAIIKNYKSLQEAAKKNNIDARSIAKVCKWQRKTAWWYQRKYI